MSVCSFFFQTSRQLKRVQEFSEPIRVAGTFKRATLRGLAISPIIINTETISMVNQEKMLDLVEHPRGQHKNLFGDRLGYLHSAFFTGEDRHAFIFLGSFEEMLAKRFSVNYMMFILKDLMQHPPHCCLLYQSIFLSFYLSHHTQPLFMQSRPTSRTTCFQYD